ncbi:DUF368 domain-containing protein [Salisaeta longa]|uniref:DUF368 domain-containing protein n=1 Tax=Salisaeta longa TaxID=503170 RepID=UPI0003B3B57A|nr:DUF368 domain-containing protein [Salisaeta longa]
MPPIRTILRHVAQGFLMGGADIIPGVSGGTMALIVGVYERLVAAISHAARWALALLRGAPAERRAQWQAIEWRLILPLGAGIGGALVLGAQIIPPLLNAYPAQMQGLFLGLVGASIAIPALRMEQHTWRHGLIALVFAIAAFYFTGLPAVGMAEDPGMVRVFVSAASAICAMILPGVSGAFLLKVLGLYEATLGAINTFDLVYLAVFAAGAGLGLSAFATLLQWLLRTIHDGTMAALLGLMVGALRALWPYTTPQRALQWPGPGDPVASVALLALAGAAFVGALTWYSVQRSSSPVSTVAK